VGLNPSGGASRANDEHVAMLMKGVDAWKAWRKKKPYNRPELSEAELIGANLSGADLSGANLNQADLSEADLSGANLNQADLSRADLSRADLFKADLGGANLSGADSTGQTSSARTSLERSSSARTSKGPPCWTRTLRAPTSLALTSTAYRLGVYSPHGVEPTLPCKRVSSSDLYHHVQSSP
jgi:hypothetical protein